MKSANRITRKQVVAFVNRGGRVREVVKHNGKTRVNLQTPGGKLATREVIDPVPQRASAQSLYDLVGKYVPEHERTNA